MKILKTHHFLLFLITCVSSQTVNACEFHDSFGGPSWSHFGQHSTFSPQRYSSAHSSEESKIKLNVPAMINASQNEKIELPISYSYATGNADPTIHLLLDIDSAAMTADNENAVLNGKNGEHTFGIVPKNTGVYRLMVTARAIDLHNSSEQSGVVYVKVTN